MKTSNRLRLALAAGLTLGVTPMAFAAGTAAGVSISSTASVDYEVGGVNQPDVTSAPAVFVVDRKIDLTVAESGGAATQVVPGSTARVTTFTVTNTSNSILDFRLVASQAASAATTAFGGTDSFDMTGLTVFVETNGVAGYQAGADTATFIDELAIGSSKTVYVVGSVPASVVNGDIAGVTLTAIAAESTDGTGAHVTTANTLAADAVETNVNVVDDPAFVDTVFADIAADASGSTAADGRHSDDDQYNVLTAMLAVTKAASVITDPFNCATAGDPSSCATPPKAIPGAVVEYCLDVENTGSATADSIVLTDNVPTNTTYVTGSLKTGGTGTGTACDVGSGTTRTDAADGDAAEFVNTGNGAVTIRTSSIVSSARFKASFRVTVN